MIVDASAIVSILKEEAERDRLRQCITRDPSPKIGAPTELETGMVLISYLGIGGRTLLERFLQEMRISIVPFTRSMVRLRWMPFIDLVRAAIRRR